MNYKLRRSIQQLMVVGITATFATGAFAALGQQNPPPGPNQVPDYFGIVPNFANSPEPVLTVVSGGSGTGAAATTYDYGNWATTSGVTDVQGGTGYFVDDVLTVTGGAVGATCTVTVANIDDAGAIVPKLDPNTGAVITPAVKITDTACSNGFTTPIASTGIRKFLDALPGIPGVSSYLTGAGYDAHGANLLGQSLPVAVADTKTFPGSDYYEIEETEYTKQLHSDLPATHLRGYRQLNNGTDASGNNSIVPPTGNQYLGPIIVAQKGRAVRIKLVNHLSTGAAGKLPLPVDVSYMGADTDTSTDNRTALHLHGGNTPWISDGTPRQTVKPAGEVAPNKGASARDVPDMWFDASGNVVPTANVPANPVAAGLSNNPGDGSLTFYFTNQQSARLMFYHDHAEGITRLNVYAGMAAGYIIQDPTEQALVKGGTAYDAAQRMGYTGTELAKYDSTSSAPIYPAVLPDLPDTIPLVIQEKTFVPNNTKPVMNFYAAFASQLQSQDPTWRWGTGTADPVNGLNGNGDLWVPHVFMPNQNPGDISGGNAMGRWDYGPWFWPPFTAISNGPITNPYYDPACLTTTSYCEPKDIPGVPNGSATGVKDAMNKGAVTTSPSGTPEAFNDTPLVNGTAYPYINVTAKPYRLRLLSVGNDRMLNLSLVVAASKNSKTIAADNAGKTGQAVLCDGVSKDPSTGMIPDQADCTEVKMVPFDAAQNTAKAFPAWWYTMQKGGVTFDGRPSGVFDPATRGPAMVQIGTEGGFLSSPVVIKNQPVNYEYNPKNILIGNIKEHALLLGPAERADVLVDFSNYAGSTLILYNDAPAPMPAWDLRLDYYTGNYDNTDTGGAFSTIPGYGPNTRTVMQIRVAAKGSSSHPADDLGRYGDNATGAINPALVGAIQTAFRTSQEPIIVPQAAYNPVYGTSVPDSLGTDLSRIADYQLTFKPLIKDVATGKFSILSSDPTVTLDMAPKTIIEDWTMNWGRMNALLGTEVPRTTSTIQTSIPQAYIDPPTELVKITPNTNATPIGGTLADGTSLWKITHNGVDSHAIHFHLFHVQIVNRVGWDGAIYPPEANELGWKDVVLMHPLSDVIVALRPMKMDLPFKVANSHRKIDPSSNAQGTDFFDLNPMTGNSANVTGNNLEMNYGWEYVWHCHILGHEENDMMRAIAVAQPPEAPTVMTATTVPSNGGVKLNWKDNSMTANWVEITRSLDGKMLADGSAFQTVNATFNMPVASLIDQATGKVFGKKECDAQAGCLLSYTDKTAAATTSYYYRVVANNTVGGGAGRADKPLSPVAGGGWTYSENLPAAVNSLVPNLADVNGVMGYTGYANVTASSDAATANRPVPMPIAVVSPANLAFGTIATNNSSVLPVTLTNTGTLALTISTANNTKISITGTNANQFSFASTCGSSLVVQATCTINVTFKPTSAGNKTATLTITDNSNNVANSKQTVTLSGAGVVLPPIATLDVSALTFPDTIVTIPSAAQTVTLTNTGSSTLTVNRAIAFTGPFARSGGSCTTGNGTFTLTAGSSCTVGVSFTPTATGAAAGSLAITNTNAGGATAKTQTVTLSGNGIPLALPDVPTGVTAVNGTVTNRNNTITAGLSWSTPTTGGAAASYNVQWSTSSTMSSPTKVTGATSNTQITIAVASGTSVYMQVQSVNATGSSAWSSPAVRVTAQ